MLGHIAAKIVLALAGVALFGAGVYSLIFVLVAVLEAPLGPAHGCAMAGAHYR